MRHMDGHRLAGIGSPFLRESRIEVFVQFPRSIIGNVRIVTSAAVNPIAPNCKIPASSRIFTTPVRLLAPIFQTPSSSMNIHSEWFTQHSDEVSEEIAHSALRARLSFILTAFWTLCRRQHSRLYPDIRYRGDFPELAGRQSTDGVESPPRHFIQIKDACIPVDRKAKPELVLRNQPLTLHFAKQGQCATPARSMPVQLTIQSVWKVIWRRLRLSI